MGVGLTLRLGVMQGFYIVVIGCGLYGVCFDVNLVEFHRVVFK